jgi:hypothetical protein
MTRSTSGRAGVCVLPAPFSVVLCGCGSGSAVERGGLPVGGGLADAGGPNADGGTTPCSRRPSEGNL